MYLMPTMDQQIFVFAEIVKETGYTAAVILDGSKKDPSSPVMQLLYTVKSVYEIELAVVDDFDKKYEIILDLTRLTSAKLEAMFTLLRDNYECRVMMLFEEFKLNYDEIKERFQYAPRYIQQRFYISTNLPLWTDFSAATTAVNSVLAEYHKVYTKAADTSPLTLQAWYNAAVLSQLVECYANWVGKSLVDCVYALGTLTAGPTKFKLYSRSNDSVFNYGALDIRIASLEKIFSASSVPYSFSGPYNPPFLQEAVAHQTLTITLLLFALLFPLFLFLFLLLLVLHLVFFWPPSRDNSSAPKSSENPVAVMFTDIQSSTSLWALDPQRMVKAMEAHHKIIRKEIAKFECYEVKTIGDSFMIASHDSYKMVQLAMAIQDALYLHDWETEMFDRFYVASEEQYHGGNGEKNKGNLNLYSILVNDTLLLTAYKKIWNGLRVRIGIHVGLCDIRFDEVTQGYDYYGDTVNTAARTESSATGGQILITQSAWDVINERCSVSQVERLPVLVAGLYTLRGIHHPVQMYQIDVFPNREMLESSLTSGIGIDYPESSYFVEKNDEGEELLKDAEAEAVFTTMEGALSAFSMKKRYVCIEPLLRQWGIDVRTQFNKYSNRDLEELLRRFANRTGKIFAERTALRGLKKACACDPGRRNSVGSDLNKNAPSFDEVLSFIPDAMKTTHIPKVTRGTSPIIFDPPLIHTPLGSQSPISSLPCPYVIPGLHGHSREKLTHRSKKRRAGKNTVSFRVSDITIPGSPIPSPPGKDDLQCRCGQKICLDHSRSTACESPVSNLEEQLTDEALSPRSGNLFSPLIPFNDSMISSTPTANSEENSTNAFRSLGNVVNPYKGCV